MSCESLIKKNNGYPNVAGKPKQSWAARTWNVDDANCSITILKSDENNSSSTFIICTMYLSLFIPMIIHFIREICTISENCSFQPYTCGKFCALTALENILSTSGRTMHVWSDRLESCRFSSWKTSRYIIKKRCQPETRMTGGAEQKSNLSKNVLQMKVHF